MNPLLNELVEIVPPPTPRLVLTHSTESITGRNLELPVDYLEFIELYGPGNFRAKFGRFLWIECIMDCLGDTTDSWFTYREGAEEYTKNLQRFGIIPVGSKTTFLRWGDDDAGESFGWLVSEAQTGWTSATAGEFCATPCGCTMLDILLRLFKGGDIGRPRPEKGYWGDPWYGTITYERCVSEEPRRRRRREKHDP